MIRKLIIICVLTLNSLFCHSQIGSLDLSFNSTDIGYGYGDGIQFSNRYGFAIAQQSDGKIIAGGTFVSYNTLQPKNLGRCFSNGYVDTTFNIPGTGLNGIVKDIKIQPDGNILIGGQFTDFNGVSRNRIARLTTDGNLDLTFDPGTGFNNEVKAIALQADGKILVGGSFLNYNGTSASRIIRLNADGSIDPSFVNGTGFDLEVTSILIQPDNKIIIGGAFNTYNGALNRCITRLNEDGTPDVTFTTGNGFSGTNHMIHSLVLQPDGRIVAGGMFTQFNTNSIYHLARLNADGTFDNTFSTNISSTVQGVVWSVAVQSDGKILASGSLAMNGNATSLYLRRFNPNGTLDSFYPQSVAPNGYFNRMLLLPGDSVLATGIFTNFGDIYRGFIAQLNSSGNPTNFCAGTGLSGYSYNGSGFSANGTTVNALVVQPDDKILLGGNFLLYNGEFRNHLVRTLSDGSIDPTFTPVQSIDTFRITTIYAIGLQNNGKIVIGGTFKNSNNVSKYGIARLESNGLLDFSFTNFSTTGFTGTPYSIAIQSDGKILVGGNFTQYNGVNYKNLIRLNTDGTIDPTFIIGTGFNQTVYCVKVQADGKILVGGNFNNYNGTNNTYEIIRLETDGTRDLTFNPMPLSPNSGKVLSIVIQPDGKIISGGDFITQSGSFDIIRMNIDGSLDNTFISGTGFNSQVRNLMLHSNGYIIAGGDFDDYNGAAVQYVAKLNSDGTIDSSFISLPGFNAEVCALGQQSSGKIIAGGFFNAHNNVGRNRVARLYDSSTGIVENDTYMQAMVYPNPSTGNVTFEFSTNIGVGKPAYFNLFDSSGMLVYTNLLTKNETRFELNYLSSGIYFYNIHTDQKYYSGKLIVE